MVLHLRRVWEMILPAFFLLCILYSNACLVVFPVRLWSWSSLVSIIDRAERKQKAKDLPSFLSKTRLPLSHRLCYRQRRLHIMDLLIYRVLLRVCSCNLWRGKDVQQHNKWYDINSKEISNKYQVRKYMGREAVGRWKRIIVSKTCSLCCSALGGEWDESSYNNN